MRVRKRVLVAAGVATLTTGAQAQSRFTSGNPEEHLPAAITQLSGFGERAVWSPDGNRIAFMSKSFGDAFEVDVRTKVTRLVTGHFRHAGFLRVHYLPNGVGWKEFELRISDHRMRKMSTVFGEGAMRLRPRAGKPLPRMRRFGPCPVRRLRRQWQRAQRRRAASVPRGGRGGC